MCQSYIDSTRHRCAYTAAVAAVPAAVVVGGGNFKFIAILKANFKFIVKTHNWGKVRPDLKREFSLLSGSANAIA